MREDCMFCSAYGQCGLATCDRLYGPEEDACDWALEMKIENRRREFYDAWQEYVREYE